MKYKRDLPDGISAYIDVTQRLGLRRSGYNASSGTTLKPSFIKRSTTNPRVLDQLTKMNCQILAIVEGFLPKAVSF